MRMSSIFQMFCLYRRSRRGCQYSSQVKELQKYLYLYFTKIRRDYFLLVKKNKDPHYPYGFRSNLIKCQEKIVLDEINSSHGYGPQKPIVFELYHVKAEVCNGIVSLTFKL